jgi:two-component system cell cycle response regulator
MQATLLIVDSVAAHRETTKGKLSTGWYDVATACSGKDALRRLAEQPADLVVVNDTLCDMPVTEFAPLLRARLGNGTPPLLALTAQVEAREPMLRAGVEDVLPFPVDGEFLLARIRSVLRATASEAEWRLRDGTSRALGFAEPAQHFERPVPVLRVGDPAAMSDEEPARRVPGLDMQRIDLGAVMPRMDIAARCSVLRIDLPESQPERGLSLLADLRANAGTRHKAILVCAPAGRGDLAARALDLGADEAIAGPMPDGEMSLRASRLHKRREINDSLRATIRSGAEAAIRDPLTGLYNRRYALPHLERVAEQSRISGRPFAVMIADLDHFKQVNDWYGHEAGDVVLEECARRLQHNMRAVDLVARIGGEEFLVVLPGTDLAAARTAAERLCQRISERPMIIPDQNVAIDMTISVGLAVSRGLSYGDADNSPKAMLARADRALYGAKATGRNRFMLGQEAAA